VPAKNQCFWGEIPIKNVWLKIKSLVFLSFDVQAGTGSTMAAGVRTTIKKRCQKQLKTTFYTRTPD